MVCQVFFIFCRYRQFVTLKIHSDFIFYKAFVKKPETGKILNVSSRATLQSKKSVADKLLIKGDLYTEILYLSESEEGRTEKFIHTMPISQIIDIPGLDENSICSITLGVREVAVARKTDTSSQGSLAEIAAKCSAMVR